jgi:hypothetical protein
MSVQCANWLLVLTGVLLVIICDMCAVCFNSSPLMPEKIKAYLSYLGCTSTQLTQSKRRLSEKQPCILWH